jgi:hypothetical protein
MATITRQGLQGHIYRETIQRHGFDDLFDLQRTNSTGQDGKIATICHIPESGHPAVKNGINKIGRRIKCFPRHRPSIAYKYAKPPYYQNEKGKRKY